KKNIAALAWFDEAIAVCTKSLDGASCHGLALIYRFPPRWRCAAERSPGPTRGFGPVIGRPFISVPALRSLPFVVGTVMGRTSDRIGREGFRFSIDRAVMVFAGLDRRPFRGVMPRLRAMYGFWPGVFMLCCFPVVD